MSQLPNLDNSQLNLSSIREQSQKELLNILKSVRGKKCLAIDPKLGGSLSLLVQTSLLKEHNVELRHLAAEPIHTECTKMLYLVRSKLYLVKLVSSHIQHDISMGLQREYFIYFVPRRTVACEKVLEEAKIRQLVSVGDFPLYFIPLDEDVISFELDQAYREFEVEGDTSSLWHVAKGIYSLESSVGVIPTVKVKGKASTKVAEILNRMHTEEPINPSDINMGIPEIDTLILLDREVDVVTPMCSQLTYEGLLDEFLHINNGTLEVEASIMGAQQEGKKIKVPLNSSDKLYKEIRDLNFEVVVQVLRQKATSMKQDYADMSSAMQTVSELKDFVRKLNLLPEMTRHINIAQHLSTFASKASFLARLDIEHTLVEGLSYDICFEYIEELVHKQESLMTVLRLLVLLSCTVSGLPKKHFDYFRREILHSYGFEHISTLINLEKAGFLRKQETKTNWPTVKKALHLVVDDIDTSNPKDIAFVFSGYAPLSVRLIDHAMRSGWRPIEEFIKLLPGPYAEHRRTGFSRICSSDMLQAASTNLDKVDGRRSLVLVIFIGGVTFAEISALRFLSAQEGMVYDIIIGTTKIINGNTLLESFMD